MEGFMEDAATEDVGRDENQRLLRNHKDSLDNLIRKDPIEETTEEHFENRARKAGVSIDVTKALVLLGFDSWSSLEPGIKAQITIL